MIDPATFMGGWHKDDFLNKQMELMVNDAKGKREAIESDRKRRGLHANTNANSANAKAPQASASEPSLRWTTTTAESLAEGVGGDRDPAHPQPTRSQLIGEYKARKQHNNSTSIDNSGFDPKGEATSKDWCSDMHFGQRDLSPEKLKSLVPSAAERAKTKERKLNFKFRAQFDFGNAAQSYEQTSTLKQPTAAETNAVRALKNDSLSALVKESKIEFLFNEPNHMPTKQERFHSTSRANAAPSLNPTQILAERAHARQMKSDLTTSTYSMAYEGQTAPSKTWRTSSTDATLVPSAAQAREARGVMEDSLKADLRSHHFEFGDPKKPVEGRFETNTQRAYRIIEGERRDPIADKRHAIELKKNLVKTTYKLGWQDEYR